MKQLRSTVIRAGLEALYFSGAHHLLRPLFAGVGAIFMLHHVRPASSRAFQPNHHLEIEPSFLRAMLLHLRERGLDIVTMDEAYRRLVEKDFSSSQDMQSSRQIAPSSTPWRAHSADTSRWTS